MMNACGLCYMSSVFRNVKFGLLKKVSSSQGSEALESLRHRHQTQTVTKAEGGEVRGHRI